MIVMGQAMASRGSVMRFTDFLTESACDEDAIALHQQCADVFGALKEEIERAADREGEEKRYAQWH
jgi:hypothetical protein